MDYYCVFWGNQNQCFYTNSVNGSYNDGFHSGNISSFMTSIGASQSDATLWNSSATLAQANGTFEPNNSPFNSGDAPFTKYNFSVPETQQLSVYLYPTNNVFENQELKVEFYPDGNVETNQELQVLLYPDGNITEGVNNQELKVEFYPDGNVSEYAQIQELKVEFYPDGNVSDVETPVASEGFKWWFGMKGNKKYGSSRIKRIRL